MTRQLWLQTAPRNTGSLGALGTAALVVAVALPALAAPAAAATAPPVPTTVPGTATTLPPGGLPETQPMQYSWLTLDQPGGTLVPSWTVSGPAGCSNLAPPGAETGTATLSSGAGGAAQFGLSWASGNVNLNGPVLEVDPGDLQLNLQFGSSFFEDQTTLSGYGTSFSAPATVTASQYHCVWSGTATLTLDGTGLTCSGGSSSDIGQLSDVRRPDQFSLFSGPPCPLFMSVQTVSGGQSPFGMKSGVSYIASGEHHVGFTSDSGNYPEGSPFTGQCVSGCVDLLATVGLGQTAEPGQPAAVAKPVEDASVTATLVGLSSPDGIINSSAGMGTLCAAGESSLLNKILHPNGGVQCGTTVNTTTGQDGTVPLRYFGPASWQYSDSTSTPEAYIKFTATAHDCRSACVQQETGTPTDVSVNIEPHVIYQKDAILTGPEFGALVQWVSASGISSSIQALASELGKLKVFDDFRIVKSLKGASKTLHLADEASEVILLNLFEKKFGLTTEGLDNYDFKTAESWLVSLIKNPAYQAAINYLTNAVFGPNNVFDDQFIDRLKLYAQSLALDPGAKNITHQMTLKVYEGSFCLDVDCRPGLPPDPVASGPGPHYDLEIAFSSTDKAAPGTGSFFKNFVVDTGYAAPTWVSEQCAAKCADNS